MKSKTKIMSIVGARPQFIKLVSLAERLSGKFRHVIVHTGQHYDDNMSGIFFRQLRLPKATINLGIGGGLHGAMTGRMLASIEKTLLHEKPQLVLVYGDTNTTLAAALAAAKLNIPVGHVEAGLRSFVSSMPEEINRRLTDHISKLLFCPTSTAIKNIRAEGIKSGLVHSGDLMYELLHKTKSVIKANTKLLRRYDLDPGRFVLLTVHRAVNVDSKEQLIRLTDILEDLPIRTLFPIHPRTRKHLKDYHLLKRLNNNDKLIVTEPLAYLDILSAAFFAQAVMTDSGGLQKEAVFLRTPVLTLRDETEWVETLTRGNHLVGFNKSRILKLLHSNLKARPMPYRINNKQPSQIVVNAITRFLAGR